MNIIKNIVNKLTGLVEAIGRYPLTMVFLLAITVVNILSIHNDSSDYFNYLFTFIVGGLLSIVAQQIYERFFSHLTHQLLLMGGAILLTILYYFTIATTSVFSVENGIKTAVIVFALFMTFIWVPSIKNSITFNDSFLAAFKSFFTTVLFTAVIAGGISAIVFATDLLLFTVPNKTIPHVLNLVASLFTPLFFLSHIPVYPGKLKEGREMAELSRHEERLKKATSYPKFLDMLISNIVIPLTFIYTIILLLYVLLNIRGDFWTKNLLEPLLVSYAITVILVYILASNLDNFLAQLFKRIFPKVLIPIVLFQMIASLLKIKEMGVTYGRYYVIMFGLFAFIAGIMFILLHPKKNGHIVAVLLAFSVISITPPVDAFTVSQANQVHLLEKTLLKNNMLINNKVVPNDNIPAEDKQIITRTISYLYNVDGLHRLNWIPKNILSYDRFYATFGFNEVYDINDPEMDVPHQYLYVSLEGNAVFDIGDYDVMTAMQLSSSEGITTKEESKFEKDGVSYTIVRQRREEMESLVILNNKNEEMIRLELVNIFDTLTGDVVEGQGSGEDILTSEQATFVKETPQAKLGVIIKSLDMYDSDYNIDMYVLVKIK